MSPDSSRVLRIVAIVLGSVLVLGLLGSLAVSAFLYFGSLAETEEPVPLFLTEESQPVVTDWTESYMLYGQPHVVWLSEDQAVGANRELLERVLDAAREQRRTPELAVYSIPMRDLGQSSAGGFETVNAYLRDKQHDLDLIRAFVDETGIQPRIILEPDALPSAIQERREQNDSQESLDLYWQRVRLIRTLVDYYHGAGALVYLEAGHSEWFDYLGSDVDDMATVLDRAGIAKADGLVTNVANRQPLVDVVPPNEAHYLSRLLPRLENTQLDVMVDTSRNGDVPDPAYGKTETFPRLYYLHPDGRLIDNEVPEGRLVGAWRRDGSDTMLMPFFGEEKRLSHLLHKEKYEEHDVADGLLIQAPRWLDPVGDVKPGIEPTDEPPFPLNSYISRYRYIKPPDECDGAVNCPPGASKADISAQTNERQPGEPLVDPAIWL